MARKTEKRTVAGGAATGGGMNFQAAVTAIALIHMARGCALSWLPGLVDDIPVAVDAETGGPGDDVRLLLADGRTVEIQAKKGLRATDELWQALLALAKGVTGGAVDFGVLAIAPDSSGTIAKDLARDIVRMGEGRTDGLSETATKLIEKLKAAGIDAKLACSRIRVQTIHAIPGDLASVAAAKAELAHALRENSQVLLGWNTLLADAARLIEGRGRRGVADLLASLRSAGLATAWNSSEPLALLDRLTRWTMETNATYTIVGVDRPLSVDYAWIELTATVRDDDSVEPETLEQAVRKYQDWESRTFRYSRQRVDPETLGRFVPKAVLVAGPGMGKSTLLRRIARRYSEDGIPVLKVRLSEVARRLSGGDGFEEAVFALGLDGSGIAPADARRAGLTNWLLLCDGLDECGKLQERVAEGVSKFAAGYPDSRILVTTRPIGYQAAHFREWRHYDLPALDYSSAHTSAARLLTAIGVSGDGEEETASDLSRRELSDTPAARVVGRTPLMLSLAVSILARGRTLPHSRERLYEEMFRLIDEVPNTRVVEPPETGAVARRFLDILGWSLTEHPFEPVAKTLGRCASWLTGELQIASLAAAGKVEGLLAYWEQVGIVERVGHDDRVALSFIHKSFGEFAAARQLNALPASERAPAIARALDDPAWAEVLRFAALLGLADEVASQLVARTLKARELDFALELLADGIPPPHQASRTAILDAVLQAVSGDRPYRALHLAPALVRAAARYPDEVAPRLKDGLASGQAWTRLIAWSCAVAAGPDHFALDDLMAAVPEILRNLEPSIKPSLVGGMSLGGGPDRAVAEMFVLAACEQMLDRVPDAGADDLVQEALACEQLSRISFLRKSEALMISRGRTLAPREPAMAPRNIFARPEGYFEAVLAMWDAVFEALDVPLPGDNVVPGEKPLLNLSAFCEASYMMGVNIGDVWGWQEPFDKAALRETLRAFIGAAGIDRERLREELAQARAYLATPEARTIGSILALTSDVDPEDPDWARAADFDVDAALVEAAVHHPSHWVQWIATHLLIALLPRDELVALVGRLFDSGEDLQLWAGMAMASKLPPEVSGPLALGRLAKPLVRGCGYLFRLLGSLDLPTTPQLAEAIRSGLLADDVGTVEEAADLVLALDCSALPEIGQILDDAYAHWLVHEEPYPEGGGRVPHSPREKILKARCRITPLTYDGMKVLLTDRRSEIAALGGEALAKRLGDPDGEQLQLVSDIADGSVHPARLQLLFREGVPLGGAELAAVEQLLTSENDAVRYHAVEMLDARYIARDRIRDLASTMSVDEVAEIRERAFAILDRL